MRIKKCQRNEGLFESLALFKDHELWLSPTPVANFVDPILSPKLAKMWLSAIWAVDVHQLIV
jgi:hypothetical protein